MNEVTNINSEAVAMQPNFNDLPEGGGIITEPEAAMKAIDKQVRRIASPQPLPVLKPLLKVGGEIWATPGNISVTTGKSKSRKTFLSVSTVAALINPEIEVMNMQGHLHKEHGQVLYFDTEQGDLHFIAAGKHTYNVECPSCGKDFLNLLI